MKVDIISGGTEMTEEARARQEGRLVPEQSRFSERIVQVTVKHADGECSRNGDDTDRKANLRNFVSTGIRIGRKKVGPNEASPPHAHIIWDNCREPAFTSDEILPKSTGYKANLAP